MGVTRDAVRDSATDELVRRAIAILERSPLIDGHEYGQPGDPAGFAATLRRLLDDA